LGEQFLESPKYGRYGLRPEVPESAYKAFDIDGPKLIQGDKARSALKATGHAPRIRTPRRRHWRDDDGPQVLVEFIW
jgi:hypothetical protein